MSISKFEYESKINEDLICCLSDPEYIIKPKDILSLLDRINNLEQLVNALIERNPPKCFECKKDAKKEDLFSIEIGGLCLQCVRELPAGTEYP